MVPDAPTALAELDTSPSFALIIVSPRSGPDLEQFTSAVHLRHPLTTCWAYHPDAPADRAMARLNGKSSPTASTSPGRSDLSVSPSRPNGPLSEPLLSRDEIDMLLGRSDLPSSPTQPIHPDDPQPDADSHSLDALLQTAQPGPAPHDPPVQATENLPLHLQPSARVPAPPASELGDIDLVESLLHDRPSLVELALTIVRQRSGIHAIGLDDDARSLPDDDAVASVDYRGEHFGLLHAPPPAGPAQLEPWAAWLARWLALERKTHSLLDQAHRDELTGAYNRRYFNLTLRRLLERGRRDRFRVTVMVFDIDDFKLYNDRHGHAAGDEILRETARLMMSVVRRHDVVARIGGDEFAVIFWDADRPRSPNSEHPKDVRKAAQRFQAAVRAARFPKLADQAPGTLTISGGLASFPWDGRTPDELVQQADSMAMRSKQQGKNAITFGPGAMGSD